MCTSFAQCDSTWQVVRTGGGVHMALEGGGAMVEGGHGDDGGVAPLCATPRRVAAFMLIAAVMQVALRVILHIRSPLPPPTRLLSPLFTRIRCPSCIACCRRAVAKPRSSGSKSAPHHKKRKSASESSGRGVRQGGEDRRSSPHRRSTQSAEIGVGPFMVKERVLPKQILSTVRLCDELALKADSRADRTSKAATAGRASKRRRYVQRRDDSDESDEALGGSAWKRPQGSEREMPSSSRAAQYMRDMKKQFKGQPGVHRQFFMILRYYKEKAIKVHQVMHAIADLFVHYERFLYGFDHVRLLPSSHLRAMSVRASLALLTLLLLLLHLLLHRPVDAPSMLSLSLSLSLSSCSSFRRTIRCTS